MKYIEWQTANVYGIYGHLGGGKTLTAVDIAVEFLRRGFPVDTNIKLRDVPNPDKYTFIPDIFDYDPWKFHTGAPRGSSSRYRAAVILDEVAEAFDQYSSTSQRAKTFLSWLRHSSKRGQFVFLIVQKPEFLQKSLRLLVNRWIVCDDMEQFRVPVFRIKVPWLRPYVRRLVQDRYGNLIGRGPDYAQKSIFGRYYNTAQSIALEGRDVPDVQDAPSDPWDDFFWLWFLLAACYSWFVFSSW